MTRLDATSEASMEDILASIRKIIAEDPPGSRPAPAASSPAPEKANSGFMSRDAFLKTSARPAAPSADSALRAATGSVQPSVAQPSAAPAAAPASALRVEPAAAPAPKADPKPEAAKAEFAKPESFKPEFSRPEFSPFPKPESYMKSPRSEPAAALSAASPPGAEAKSAAQPAASEVASPRPGFTVSRVGFNADGAPVETKPADPFDFDIGPSPFAVKAEAAASASVPAQVPAPAPSSSQGPSSLASEAAAAARAVEAAVSARDEARYERPLLALPSVAATLQPVTNESSSAEAEVEIVPAASTADAAAASAVADPVIDPPSQSSAVALTAREVEASAASIAEAAMQTLPVTQPLDAEGRRLMEDAVADLLRPMLKTWLAENMPRIVERALRRELLEKSGGEHKSAAE